MSDILVGFLVLFGIFLVGEALSLCIWGLLWLKRHFKARRQTRRFHIERHLYSPLLPHAWLQSAAKLHILRPYIGKHSRLSRRLYGHKG